MPMKITNFENSQLSKKENSQAMKIKIKNHKGKLPSQKRKFPIIENNKNKGYKRIIQRF